MSLLLDALKKAETAKRQKGAGEGAGPGLGEADRSGRDAVLRERDPQSSLALVELGHGAPGFGGGPADPPGTSPDLNASSWPAMGGPPGGGADSEGPRSGPGHPSAIHAPGSRAGAGPRRTGREAARQVFGANRRPARPVRRLLLWTGAGLAMILGVLGYYGWLFYTTVQPSTPYIVPPRVHRVAAVDRPVPPAREAIGAGPAPAGTPSGQGQAATDDPVLGPSGDVSGSPSRPVESLAAPTASPPARQPEAGAPVEEARPATASPAGVPTPAPQEQRTPSVSAGSGPSAGELASGGGASSIVISRTRAKDDVFPRLQGAYRAFQAGDYPAAERAYRRVLAGAPENHDALLGLAAVALAMGRTDEAREVYSGMLSLNPNDRVALAALSGMGTGGGDPRRRESRLKRLLEQAPDAAYLHFALGTLYAERAGWALAQQSFFEAYRYAPENGDYAFNLAVSLDHLGQPKTALDYYRVARKLAETQPVRFDREGLERRIHLLAPGTGIAPP